MKKISVIIPYKDEAKYIKDCVSTIPESAEIEILLVADGGEETVPQWVFEDQRISVILPEEGKGGVAACRNLGIQKARGEYVYFLDADDYVAEPALSALMEAAGEERLLLTGPVAYSWYSPINYTPDRIQWERRTGSGGKRSLSYDGKGLGKTVCYPDQCQTYDDKTVFLAGKPDLFFRG